MERKKNGREEIKPLLLKLLIPLALPLAGLIFSIITRRSRTRNKTSSNISSQEESLMDSSASISLCEFDDEDSSQVHESSSMYQQEEGGEQQEEKEPPKNCGPSEIMRLQCSEIPNEVSIINLHHVHNLQEEIESFDQVSNINLQDVHNLQEEIESLKSVVAATDDRACEIESQFQGYCDAKEQESLFMKLQIMCLGYKLECLEAQNQRLQSTISSQQVAIEQLKGMRAELKWLKRKAKMFSESDRLHLHEARRQAQILDARDAELSRINEELKQVKDLADRLLEGKKTLDEKLDSLTAKVQSASKTKEERIQDEHIRILSNKELLDQLQQFRYEWYLEMEELIYLGWVGACLRHELLMNQKEEDEDDDVKVPVQEIRDQLIMVLPANDEVKSCRVEFHDSDCSSPHADLGHEACLDVAGRKNHSGLKKPRLIHKLKGWARGKGKSKQFGNQDGDRERH